MTEAQPRHPTAPGGSAQQDPDQLAKIEAEIDQTRNAISGDLRTLGERLSPENLKAEAKEVMTEAKNVATETLHEAKNVATSTFHQVKEDAMESVSAKVDELRDGVRNVEQEAMGFLRENAAPIALIGVGLAWFLSNRRARDDRWDGGYRVRGSGRWRYPEDDADHPPPLDDARESFYRAAGRTREASHTAGQRARSWADGARHEVSDKANQMRHFAERELGDVRGMARNARDRLERTSYRARDTAQRELRHAREVSERTLESHPLAVAAAAVAAGACIGLLLPETRREDELFGARRERLMDDAREVIREAKGAARDVGHSAKETARDLKNDLKNGSIGTTG